MGASAEIQACLRHIAFASADVSQVCIDMQEAEKLGG
jgi:hypothetical protein